MTQITVQSETSGLRAHIKLPISEGTVSCKVVITYPLAGNLSSTTNTLCKTRKYPLNKIDDFIKSIRENFIK